MPQKNATKVHTDYLKPYNEAFYKKRAPWRADYTAISEWINKNFDGGTVGDIGCGNGFMITALEKLGKKVWGVDAAGDFGQITDKKIRSLVKKADVTQAQKLVKSDVVICFDVADRIDKKYVDTLLKNIAGTKADTILFTASGPGEAGIHHLNLQPKKYWLEKFSKHGYCLDTVLTKKFTYQLSKSIKNLVWYPKDILVLQKCDDPMAAKAYLAGGDFIDELIGDVEALERKNATLTEELWATAQKLNSILNSARWKASSKLIGLIKR